MKTIDTLVPDIDEVLRRLAAGEAVEMTEEQRATFFASITVALDKMLEGRKSWDRTAKKTLYMSEIGKPCTRAVWYSYHRPSWGEKLHPHTLVKFLFGNMIEAFTLLLAKLAGHEVESENESVTFEYRGWEFRGRLDAVVDGALLDVKSAGSRSISKFSEGLNDNNDAFGYRMQLEGYDYAKQYINEETGFLVVNKETGALVWSPYTGSEQHDSKLAVEAKLDVLIDALEHTEAPPARTFDAVPEGKSGNMKLATNCSYCDYKNACWADANQGHGLRTFIYAKGPVFLTEVVKTPDVYEVPREIPEEQEVAQ